MWYLVGFRWFCWWVGWGVGWLVVWIGGWGCCVVLGSCVMLCSVDWLGVGIVCCCLLVVSCGGVVVFLGVGWWLVGVCVVGVVVGGCVRYFGLYGVLGYWLFMGWVVWLVFVIVVVCWGWSWVVCWLGWRICWMSVVWLIWVGCCRLLGLIVGCSLWMFCWLVVSCCDVVGGYVRLVVWWVWRFVWWGCLGWLLVVCWGCWDRVWFWFCWFFVLGVWFGVRCGCVWCSMVIGCWFVCFVVILVGFGLLFGCWLVVIFVWCCSRGRWWFLGCCCFLVGGFRFVWGLLVVEMVRVWCWWIGLVSLLVECCSGVLFCVIVFCV